MKSGHYEVYFTLQLLRSWSSFMPWRPSQKQRKLPGVFRHSSAHTPASHSSTSDERQCGLRKLERRDESDVLYMKGYSEAVSSESHRMRILFFKTWTFKGSKNISTRRMKRRLSCQLIEECKQHLSAVAVDVNWVVSFHSTWPYMAMTSMAIIKCWFSGVGHGGYEKSGFQEKKKGTPSDYLLQIPAEVFFLWDLPNVLLLLYYHII